MPHHRQVGSELLGSFSMFLLCCNMSDFESQTIKRPSVSLIELGTEKLNNPRVTGMPTIIIPQNFSIRTALRSSPSGSLYPENNMFRNY
ncbi:hypothetical protein SprV_0301026800 [Sparganum proliferum]